MYPMAWDAVSEQLAARYRRFADVEAHDRSPLYEAFAVGVAADAFTLEFLATLPDEKRQPNLLFAALRHVCGTPRDWPEFHGLLRKNAPAVRATMLTHRTQTNEAGRCATLLPVLAHLPQPLALLEVGASAGLCLLPDRYGYDYGHRQLMPASPDAPVFPCRANPATPLPMAHTACRVAARPGSPSGRCHRRGALRMAGDAGVARAIRPAASPARGARGGKARSATCCSGRSADRPSGLRATGAEGCDAGRLPLGSARLRDGCRLARCVRAGRARAWCRVGQQRSAWGVSVNPRAPRAPGLRGAFLLAVDGVPVAWTDPHGGWIEWIGTEEGSE